MKNNLKEKIKDKSLDELLELIILGLECEKLEKEESKKLKG